MLENNKCEECAHRQVCAIQIEYRAAIKAVGEATAYIGDKTSKPVRNMPVTIYLACDHYIERKVLTK